MLRNQHRRAPVPAPRVLSASRADLLRAGWTRNTIARAVRDGRLRRPRNGVYLPSDADEVLHAAARVGGRLACVSELARRGVFVLGDPRIHVQVPPTASGTRDAGTKVHRHWARLIRDPHPRDCSVEPLDAVIQAVRCQAPRAAVATLDSALHLGVIRADDLDEVFARVPRRYRVLRKLLDARAESGPETLVRLMLRRLGRAFEVQVRIDGVGRVDLLVEGWLIVECDSEAHHGGWEARRRDLRRDQAAAARGLMTFRPIAEDIMWNPDAVQNALRGLLGGRNAAERRRNRPARPR